MNYASTIKFQIGIWSYGSISPSRDVFENCIKTPAWLWYIGDKHPIGHRWLKLRDLLSCGVLHCTSLGAIINHVICQTFVLICVLTFEGRVWLTHYVLYFNIWGICCFIYFTLQRYLVEQWMIWCYMFNIWCDRMFFEVGLSVRKSKTSDFNIVFYEQYLHFAI